MKYKNYLLGVLTILVVFNYVDRLALGIVLQDIKVDLDLSDTELGFLSGMAFALFYSVMGIPIARWADRGNRVTIISITAALWSAAVALCGTAGSFAQLLMIRVGVAVGEAGCIPPAFSLIADYFNRAERPRAAAIYGLGGPIACVIGFFVAGWLNEFYGWRTMFVLLGAPGILLALLARLTLREPRLSKSYTEGTSYVSVAVAEPPPLRKVCLTLWQMPTFRHLLASLSVNFFFSYGLLQWLPTFFIRSHGLTSGEVGTWFAVVFGIGGLLGSYFGGELAFRYAARNEFLQLRAMAFVFALCAALSTLIYTSAALLGAFAIIFVFELMLSSTNGPLFATIQTLVPERMRAVAFALVYLVANLIGMGLGPLAVGALSDTFASWAGDESLRYALAVMGPGYLWSAWHLWRASSTVMRDLAATGSDDEGLTSQDSDDASLSTEQPHSELSAREQRVSL